jgi:hypothetical protein
MSQSSGTPRRAPRHIAVALAEYVEELHVNAKAADAEALLRERIAKRCRNGRLWSVGVAGEQLNLEVDLERDRTYGC